MRMESYWLDRSTAPQCMCHEGFATLSIFRVFVFRAVSGRLHKSGEFSQELIVVAAIDGRSVTVAR